MALDRKIRVNIQLSKLCDPEYEGETLNNEKKGEIIEGIIQSINSDDKMVYWEGEIISTRFINKQLKVHLREEPG